MPLQEGVTLSLYRQLSLWPFVTFKVLNLINTL